MSDYFIIKTVDKERCVQAQLWENEVWKALPQDGDDYNEWWQRKFDNYSFLKEYNIKSILEVGCGPWAKNLQYVLKEIGTADKKLYLEDPLLNEYISSNKIVKDIPAIKFAVPLEELVMEDKVDLVICVNVLDHVYDTNKCFANMLGALNKGGIILFAQDLTNEADYNLMPITDIGHPIRIDLEVCETALQSTKPIYKKILDRKDGRNPTNHYATLLYAGIV